MTEKYLSEFYTAKWHVQGTDRVIADPKTPLETQVQAHVVAGNVAYFNGKYGTAREEYLRAWGLLPRLVDPTFPQVAGQVAENDLLAIDLSAGLMEASVQIARLRDALGPAAAITSPRPPPPELKEIADAFLDEEERARIALEAASALAQAGEYVPARRQLEAAEELAGDDLGLRGDIRTASGAMNVAEGSFDAATADLETAASLYDQAGRADGSAAAAQNLGVALTLTERAPEAAQQFAKVASLSPQELGWELTYSTNPGIASVARKMERGGLPLLMPDGQSGWTKLSSVESGRPRNTLTVVDGRKGKTLNLAQGAVAVRDRLLRPRVTAVALADLEVRLQEATPFVAYLAHVQGFVLPLALGDTYFALRDFAQAEQYYLKARDYEFLNTAIERPMVWVRLARTYLQSGHRLYRDNDRAGARSMYERIVQVAGPGTFRLSGPLYDGAFSALQAETMAFLQASNRASFTAIAYERRLVILEALAALEQLAAGFSYFGVAQVVPIHSWRYLQTFARYFATQAIQAERAYINFRSTAEREESTRLALEQAVDAQEAALEVERKRLLAAQEERRVALVNLQMANTSATNAALLRSQYATLSDEVLKLDNLLAWAGAMPGGGELFISADLADSLGIGRQNRTISLPTFVELLTRKRSSLTRAYELQRMMYDIQHLQEARLLAQAQRDVADKAVAAATAQRDLAQLRVDQTKAQLDFFNSREFTPELWDKLAVAQREISRRYIDWAIGAAQLMERAFEYEYDKQVGRIRPDYARSELHGLLAGDFLLADIDQFSFERLLETDKWVPIKVVIPLADRFPIQFQREFQRTGRLEFETSLEDFDRHPGSHLRRLRRVEVVVEGLVPPEGLNGTLTNSGVSQDRDREGRRHPRIQPIETMVLSRFTLRGDGFIFTPDEDVLEIFENSGPACHWILEFPPDANDVDFGAIANVHLALYFDALYNDRVANAVRAELAGTALFEHTLGIGLLFQFPDEFFSFQDDGSVTFTIGDGLVPHNHTAPRIRDLYVLIQTEAGQDPAGLVVTLVHAGGAPVDATTSADGLISTGAGAAPMNAFRRQPLTGGWTLRIETAKNQSRFAAGFGWDDVANVLVFAEYTYTPRGRPLVADGFEADPLNDFDVVDDARATVGAPSSWSYEAAATRVVQTSNINGPPGVPAADKSPDKPGTYLVRKTGGGWTTVRDLVLRAHLSSTDNDGIGLVFRYQDADNFYFFLIDAARQYRRIGKKVQGVFSDLAQPAFDDTRGYTVGQEYEVAVAMVGDAVQGYLDGVEILRGRDGSIDGAGRVGFYTWGNSGARFGDLSLRPA